MLEIIVLILCVGSVVIFDHFTTPKTTKKPIEETYRLPERPTLGDLFEQAKANSRKKGPSIN